MRKVVGKERDSMFAEGKGRRGQRAQLVFRSGFLCWARLLAEMVFGGIP